MSERKGIGGRPTAYKEEYCQQAYVACADGGFTINKLAKLFSVAPSTIKLWMVKHEEFSASVKKGRDEFNLEVAEQCLLKRIKGFSYKETTKKLVKTTDASTGEATEEMKTIQTVSKAVAPDTTALIFFLKNRDPKRWRDKQDVQVSGAVVLSEIVNFIDGTSRGLPNGDDGSNDTE
jgi:transposase-like protein